MWTKGKNGERERERSRFLFYFILFITKKNEKGRNTARSSKRIKINQHAKRILCDRGFCFFRRRGELTVHSDTQTYKQSRVGSDGLSWRLASKDQQQSD